MTEHENRGSCPACRKLGERAAMEAMRKATETKHAEVTQEHRDFIHKLLAESFFLCGETWHCSACEHGCQLLADHDAEVERKARLDEARRAWHDYTAAPHQCINPIGNCSQCKRIRELEDTK